MKIALPKVDDLNEYYKSYIRYITEDDLLIAMDKQLQVTSDFLETISEDESKLAYDAGKWEIKEVIGHLCDVERILLYRALRFARKDHTALEGFDEDDYVVNSNFKERPWASLKDEKKIVSLSSLQFFQNLTAERFDQVGTANGNILSVRAIMFFIIAHERHHIQVIKDRYLKK